MAEYRLMYLKQQKLVTRAARPSLYNELVRDTMTPRKALPDDFRYA